MASRNAYFQPALFRLLDMLGARIALTSTPCKTTTDPKNHCLEKGFSFWTIGILGIQGSCFPFLMCEQRDKVQVQGIPNNSIPGLSLMLPVFPGPRVPRVGSTMYPSVRSRYTAPEKKNEVHCYEGGENCQSKVSQSQGAIGYAGWVPRG